MKNYYEILEVNNKASPDIIKKVFKLQIKKYHPDVVGEGEKELAEIKVKELNEAYDILSDENKRAEYDRVLNEELESIKHNYDNQLLYEIENLKQRLQLSEQIINQFLGDLDLSEYYNYQEINNTSGGMLNKSNDDNLDKETIKESGNFEFFKWIMGKDIENESTGMYYLRIFISFLLRIFLIVIFFIFIFAVISFSTGNNVFQIFFNVFFK